MTVREFLDKSDEIGKMISNAFLNMDILTAFILLAIVVLVMFFCACRSYDDDTYTL